MHGFIQADRAVYTFRKSGLTALVTKPVAGAWQWVVWDDSGRPVAGRRPLPDPQAACREAREAIDLHLSGGG